MQILTYTNLTNLINLLNLTNLINFHLLKKNRLAWVSKVSEVSIKLRSWLARLTWVSKSLRKEVFF